MNEQFADRSAQGANDRPENKQTGAAGAIPARTSAVEAATFDESLRVKNAPHGPKDFLYGIHTFSTGKVSNYYWNNIELGFGAYCIVESGDGYDHGKLQFSRRLASGCDSCAKKAPRSVVRLANTEDMNKIRTLTRKEKSAKAFCRDRIIDLELSMSLSRVHYVFDRSRVIFFFTADNRVDFRELVKDLANYTRVKVEMRQIGVRDEAKMIGGCGPCGGELCCSTFLNDFEPVSIKMAKNQNLSLNPTKISGVCKRLMCCLSFENAGYAELQKSSPRFGKSVVTADGKVGRVCNLNLLNEKVTVQFADGSKEEFSAKELSPNPNPPKKALNTDTAPPQKIDRPAAKLSEKVTGAQPLGVKTEGGSSNEHESAGVNNDKVDAEKPLEGTPSRRRSRKRHRSRKRRKDLERDNDTQR